MTGVVGSVHMGGLPPIATIESLYFGGRWGALSGIYGSYQYALLRTYNAAENVEPFPIGTRTFTPDSATSGILATY
jgi:hypothetical protein